MSFSSPKMSHHSNTVTFSSLLFNISTTSLSTSFFTSLTHLQLTCDCHSKAQHVSETLSCSWLLPMGTVLVYPLVSLNLSTKSLLFTSLNTLVPVMCKCVTPSSSVSIFMLIVSFLLGPKPLAFPSPCSTTKLEQYSRRKWNWAVVKSWLLPSC